MVRIINKNFSIDIDSLTDMSEKITNDLKMKGDITIKLSDIEESRELNLKYRKKDYPTDVLSFPLNEKFPDSFYIGDILICFPVAKEQAEVNNISINRELFTLICHGILHLAGYDHETDSGKMLEIQNKLINRHFQE